MNELIENCYINKYNIDLKQIHIESSKRYSAADNLSIYDSNFQREKFIFSDKISSNFKLTYHNDLLYLLGDKSCYPCGKIVEGAYGINWVQIFVIPTGLEIETSSSIYKTCCVHMDTITYCLPYLKADTFGQFIEDFINSFKNNDWYGHNTLRFLITYNEFISVDNTFNELRQRNLLNPFELALGSIVYDLGISPIEVFNCLNYSKDISPQFTYIDYFKTKFSLSESTNRILLSDEFMKTIETFDSNEIEQFFEVKIFNRQSQSRQFLFGING